MCSFVIISLLNFRLRVTLLVLICILPTSTKAFPTTVEPMVLATDRKSCGGESVNNEVCNLSDTSIDCEFAWLYFHAQIKCVALILCLPVISDHGFQGRDGTQPEPEETEYSAADSLSYLCSQISTPEACRHLVPSDVNYTAPLSIQGSPQHM